MAEHNEESAELERLKARLMESLERCRTILVACRARLAASSNVAKVTAEHRR